MTRIEKIQSENIHSYTPQSAKKAPHGHKSAEIDTKDEFKKTAQSGNVVSRSLGKIKSFVSENITGKGSAAEAAGDADDFTAKAALAGGILGAGAGGAIGYAAGKIDEARATSTHETWQEPVMERKNLGTIPHDYYTSDDWYSGWSHETVHFDDKGTVAGGEPVYRDAPVYNADGSLKMKTVEANIDSKRYGIFGGTFFGVILGGIGGTLGGVAVGLINKMLRDK